MVKQITMTELREKIRDLDVSEEEIAQYLKVDDAGSSAFMPRVVPDPAKVDDQGLEADVALSLFNGWSRRRRQAKYRRKIKDGWNGIKIVSEGDSWFQYPFLLKDVIDQMFDDYAIFSLGAAGDLLEDMANQDEISSAVEQNEPHILLVSACGNDILGSGRIKLSVHPFDPALTAQDYPNAHFASRVSELIGIYRGIIKDLLKDHPALKIICHGYDYAVPDNGRWLGDPLKELGIENKSLQADIIKQMIDRFYDSLMGLSQEFEGSLFIVNCRNAVDADEWHDELHPNNSGYAKVATRFRAVIDSVLPTNESMAVEEPLCPGREHRIADSKDLDPTAFRQLVARRGRELLDREITLTDKEEDRRETEAEISRHFEKISGGADFLPASFLRDGSLRAKAVCRMKLPGGSGTGFLISSNQFIMTNNHVIGSKAEAEDCIAEFGFEDESTITSIKLQPDRFFTTDAPLDFTIVACDGAALGDVEAIPLLRNPATVTRNERVNIIQHPRGRPKEVALHDNEVQRVRDKVIWYETDTEPGSSGSPVFNNTWDLVALHHAGWRNADGTATNEGVRMASIVAKLISRQRNEFASSAELQELLGSIPDSAPHLGFFDIDGLSEESGFEVEVPDFSGSANHGDVGFWNIEHFNNDVSPSRIKRVAEVVGHLSLDALGLVEVERGAMDSLTQELQRNGFDYNYKYFNVRGRQDLAVLYDNDTTDVTLATDILNRHRDALKVRTSSGRTAFPRRPLIARVKIRPGTEEAMEFIMIAVHLKAFGDPQSRARRRLAAKVLQEIIEDIRATERLPVVLGGDLNETLNTDVLSALTDAPDLVALTSDDADANAISYVGARHRSLIDHIIVSNDVRMAPIAGDDAAIVRLDRSVRDFADDISDHVPLVIRMVGRTAPIDVEEPAETPGTGHTITIPDGASSVAVEFT